MNTCLCPYLLIGDVFIFCHIDVMPSVDLCELTMLSITLSMLMIQMSVDIYPDWVRPPVMTINPSFSIVDACMKAMGSGFKLSACCFISVHLSKWNHQKVCLTLRYRIYPQIIQAVLCIWLASKHHQIFVVCNHDMPVPPIRQTFNL